ncbi:hypothetical protein [Aquimarina spongiae]|uniref:Lipoprotein n=1 Tax=Aquimarina spongiae TaxID=570521 RepID=A0A1M6BDA6_9FLAO|nr:hypothetical protein [Aquimarina spongiae]SHI46730.1 hypothetical protein SAMN04488508_101760 [Aquimarina spongiae]
MKKTLLKLLFLGLFLHLVGCQTEDDVILEEENSIPTTILYENPVDLGKSSTPATFICAGTPLPNGYKIVGYLNHINCSSSFGLFLGFYNAAIIVPIGTPILSSAGSGCDDNFCIWIVGNDFESNAYVDIRTTTGNEIIGTYRGNDRVQYINDSGQDVITLRLASDFERSEFASRGLRIWVVNPDARKWGDGRTVRRSAGSNPNQDCGQIECLDP